MSEAYDVIVIGGGHAGTEASLAAARAGARTLLVTHSIATLGQMSCNPAIGGIGKGHLTKEIDALGGAMAQAIDLAGIQFRTLNASKGPAVRATRAQADRELYRNAIRGMILAQPNLEVLEAAVDDLVVQDGRATGIVTENGDILLSRAVVLTVGTFLGGRILIGSTEEAGGRVGDKPSNRLAARLREMPFNVARLKTGTPPRLDGRTLDYQRMQEQPGDDPLPVFSFLGERGQHPQQVSCFITKTTEETHDIIRGSLDESPMYTGLIDGVGPRYCPSIEDKIVRFADKASHQIFVEPEGLTTTPCTRTAFRPACRARPRSASCGRSSGSRARKSRSPVTRSNTTTSIREISGRRWRHDICRACISRARSMARRVTKRRAPRACSRASMRHARPTSRRSGSPSATRRTSVC